MKTFTRVIAVIMMIAVLASLMAACGSKYYDKNVVGTWKQTDEIDGNWTWTFNEDGTCSLVGETTGFNSTGTYYMENAENGKLHINLENWTEEQLFTYAVTPKVMDLESTYMSFHCFKQ